MLVDVGKHRQQSDGRVQVLTRIRDLTRSERRGVAAVEFALIAPVFLLLVLGVIEFGRLLMVQQVLTNASREGARRAVVEGATVAEVKQVVSDCLTNASISSTATTINVTPSSLSAITFGDDVAVSASISFNDVSWIPSPWFLNGTSLTASSMMSGERP